MIITLILCLNLFSNEPLSWTIGVSPKGLYMVNLYEVKNTCSSKPIDKEALETTFLFATDGATTFALGPRFISGYMKLGPKGVCYEIKNSIIVLGDVQLKTTSRIFISDGISIMGTAYTEASHLQWKEACHVSWEFYGVK